MRRRNSPSAKRPQAPRLQYGFRPPRSAFAWSARLHFPHPPSLSWPLRLRLRGRPPEPERLRGPAQTEEARPITTAGRPDLSVVLMIICAAVVFELLLFVAGWMQLYHHW
jgi:hypothetical protein